MIIRELKNFKVKSVWSRLIFFLLILAIIWIPFAIPISLLLKANSNLATIITMGLLFIFFLFLQKLWGKYIYQQPFIFRQYGLTNNWLIFLQGLAIGFCFCWSLFITEALLGWITINNTSESLGKIVLEGLLSAFGIALLEELIFRGWILYELEQDYRKNTALWVSSILFAIAHFLKPIAEVIRTLITFPALLLLGLILVWAKRKYCDCLNICIGIHAGLVWGYYILNVGNLITDTNQVSDWITGIDGNPIAGVLGLVFLGVLALLMKSKVSYLSADKRR
jgi:uncharacterized protein